MAYMYLKNWTDNFNGANVAKHWHGGGGARYLPSLIALLVEPRSGCETIVLRLSVCVCVCECVSVRPR